MEALLIVLITFIILLVGLIITVCIAYFYTKMTRKQSSNRTMIVTEEQPTSGPPISSPASFKQTGSGEKTDLQSKERQARSPARSGPKSEPTYSVNAKAKPQTRFITPEKVIFSAISKTKSVTSQTRSFAEKSMMDKSRMKLRHFKFAGHHKRFAKLPAGPLVHAYSHVSRNQTPLAKIQSKDIKGEIMMYGNDFEVPLMILAGTKRKYEIIEQFYHLSQPVLDGDDYRRKRNGSMAIPELVPIEGNHERHKKMIEGTPFMEILPYLAKMPEKREDTTRHFILNTQYAARLAVRFVSPSGRYTSIPAFDIVEPCGRLRVVITANSDVEGTPSKEMVYYEYTQVPERATDPLLEFENRTVIGRISLRMIPNILNLSPNTFYPSTKRKTSELTQYTSTLTNTGSVPCKFVWMEDRDVSVSPQTGQIPAQSAITFTLILKREVKTVALVAEMKYSVNDNPNAGGSILARFETEEMKRMMHVSSKALAACDTAEDAGYYAV